MKTLIKLDAVFASILKCITIGCCVAIAVILFVRVILRFTPLNFNFSWSDEVVAWLMAWMIFITAAQVTRERSHFSVDLLPTKLKGKALGVLLNLFITVLSIVFFVAFLDYSVQLTMKATTFSLSPILKVSDRVPYSSMPTCCVICLIYLVRDFVVEIQSLLTGSYKTP